MHSKGERKPGEADVADVCFSFLHFRITESIREKELEKHFVLMNCNDSVKQMMKKALAVHHRTEVKKRHVHLGGIFQLSGTRILNYVNQFKDLAALDSTEKCT